jgi:hypothetical protein
MAVLADNIGAHLFCKNLVSEALGFGNFRRVTCKAEKKSGWFLLSFRCRMLIEHGVSPEK